MDTLIFILIFGVLLAMTTGKRWLVVGLAVVSLLATSLLFLSHVSSPLNLNF